MPAPRQFVEQDVVTRAMNRFWRHGHDATSIQDLVAVTGLNRGSLYATFGDKRGLFLAALSAYERDVRRARMEAAAATLSPLAAIRAILSGFLEQALDPAGQPGCFLTNTALELAAHDAEVRAIVAAGQIHAETLLRQLVKAARQAGDLPGAVHPDTAAKGLLAALLGLGVLVRSRPDPALLSAIVDHAIAALFTTQAPGGERP